MPAEICLPVFGIKASFHKGNFTLMAKGLICQEYLMDAGFV
jgi:hypothetical protein